MVKFTLPTVFENVLQCLDTGNEPVSWNRSRSYDGSFSLKIWTSKTSPVKSVARRLHKKGGHFENVVKGHSPSDLNGNVDTHDNLIEPVSVKTKLTVENTQQQPKSKRRKRKKKTASGLRRDKERRASWRICKTLSRENQIATERLLKQLDAVDTPPPANSLPDLNSSGSHSRSNPWLFWTMPANRISQNRQNCQICYWTLLHPQLSQTIPAALCRIMKTKHSHWTLNLRTLRNPLLSILYTVKI